MKSTKTMLLALLMIALIVCAFTGCNTDYAADFDDDSKIAGRSTTSSVSGASELTINNVSTFKYSTFNGTRDMWSVTNFGAGSLKIEYDLTINKGRFKCVLVDPNGEVKILFDETSAKTKTVDLLEGDSIIKFVGDGAGLELVISITTEGDALVLRKD